MARFANARLGSTIYRQARANSKLVLVLRIMRHHEEAYEKADIDEEHLDDRHWRISRQGHDE
jgi:hypothetical protein